MQNNSLKLEHWWPTPVMYGLYGIDPIELNALKELGYKYRELFFQNPIKHTLPNVKGLRMVYHQNLLLRNDLLPDEQKLINKFASDMKQTYLKYLADSYNVTDAKEYKISMKLTPAKLEELERAMPHYHHTCDHVGVFYLDCGTDRPVKKNRFKMDQAGDGELVIQDPRAGATFPFWEKVKWISTEAGMFVLHPSRLWHESNTHRGKGTRLVMTVEFKVESHNHTDIYKET